MPTPSESRQELQLVTREAVATVLDLTSRVNGSPEVRRAALLDGVPEIVGYYSEGSGALAADFYEQQRELAQVSKPFVTEVIVLDRTVKLRRAIAWATEPWFNELGTTVDSRMAEVVQLDVARAYRDTILGNRGNDPEAVGWRRITAGGCAFCRMLADRGAVYRRDTALFAAHNHCHCTAEPVFASTYTGEEASVMQYMASKRNRTPQQQAELREYLELYAA